MLRFLPRLPKVRNVYRIHVHANQRVRSGRTNCYGGSASVAGNLNKWFGVVGDIGGCRATGVQPGSNANALTYFFGAKIAYRRCCRLTPFWASLVGGMRVSGGSLGTGVGSTSGSNNAFAVAIGGGVDLTIRRCVLVARVLEADYMRHISMDQVKITYR